MVSQAVANEEIEGATLEGEGDRWTFSGQRHGRPCRGEVRLVDGQAQVRAQRCAPADATSAEHALYVQLADAGLADLAITGGPDRYVISAQGCSGNASRVPGGALAGEARCGHERHPFRGVFPGRDLTEAERGEVIALGRALATAAGLDPEPQLAIGERVLKLTGTLGGQPCQATVDLGAPTDALDLDPATCPGAGPPPQALASRESWLAWLLDHEGFADVVVGPGEQVAATIGQDRLEGTASFKGELVTVTLGGARTVVRIVSVPEVLR